MINIVLYNSKWVFNKIYIYIILFIFVIRVYLKIVDNRIIEEEQLFVHISLIICAIILENAFAVFS